MRQLDNEIFSKMEQEKIKIIYEYCILRYVPDLERGEFVNIGLMMMSKRYKWLKTDIFIHDDKILTMFKKCNISLLKKQIEVFTRFDVPALDLPVEEKYRWLAAVKSAIIQTSASHPGILIINQDSSPVKSLDLNFSNLFEKLVK